MIRVVLDTNTVISGLFWPGSPRQVYAAGFTEQIQILTSEPLLAELSDVLHRPKFAPALAALGKNAESAFADYQQAVEVVVGAEVAQEVVRDSKDLIVLACAVGGKADFIVSGDKDLLVLGSYQNIPIVNASEFLLRLNPAS